MSCSQATELNEARLQEVEELKAKVQSNIEHLNLIKEPLYQLFVQLVELEEGRGDWDRSWEEGESYHQVNI